VLDSATPFLVPTRRQPETRPSFAVSAGVWITSSPSRTYTVNFSPDHTLL